MESAHARKLTTWSVGAALALALGCLAVGLVLMLLWPSTAGARVLPYAAIAPGLLAGDPLAWLSLGTVFLILTPSVRLVGMLFTFRAEGERRALLSGAAVLLILAGALLLPAFRAPAPPADGHAKPALPTERGAAASQER